jgi:hypothetical protein
MSDSGAGHRRSSTRLPSKPATMKKGSAAQAKGQCSLNKQLKKPKLVQLMENMQSEVSTGLWVLGCICVGETFSDARYRLP